MKPINKNLGETAVCRMTAGQVVAYIRERNAAGRSNATINRELDIIRGVLKRAKALAPLRGRDTPAARPPEYRASADL